MNLPLRATLVLVVLSFFFLFPQEISSQVVINEFVPDASPEWVEFYNSSPSAEYLKSYYLDDDTNFGDDSGSSAKKILTNLDITNPTYPYIEISSFLNNSGDYVVLFDSAGAIVDQYLYTSNPVDGVSIGRSPDGSGNFAILVNATKGAPNSNPVIPSPSPAPTEAPAQEPASTPAPTPSSTPTKTPTPRPVAVSASPTVGLGETPVAGESMVLGFRNQLAASEAATSSDVPKKGFPFLPAILVLGGAACIGVSGFLFFKKLKSDYTDTTNEGGENN